MSRPCDMGIGRCCAIEGGGVFARLDSLIAKRLAPESAWNRSGGSVLRLPPRALCSVRRPPRVDEELFLDSMKLEHAAPVELDLLGNGKFEGGGLRVILAAMTPTAAAPAPGAQLVFCGEADELQ